MRWKNSSSENENLKKCQRIRQAKGNQSEDIVVCRPVARQRPHHTRSNSIGTAFSSSADGLSLCNSRAVTSHNSMWTSRDMFPARCAAMMSLTLGWRNNTVDRDVSMLSDSELHDEDQTGRKGVVVELVVERSTEEYRRSASEYVKCDWKILCVISDSEW
jgi:hypothetical protein